MDVTQAGDPDPAIDRLQIEDKVGTVAAVGIPPFEVSAADRARRGIVVARPLRLQRRAPPHSLGAALLTRLAPGRWERRWGGLRRARLCPAAARQASAPVRRSEGAIRRRRLRGVGRVPRQPFRLLDGQGMQPTREFNQRGRIQRLKEGAVHAREVYRRFLAHRLRSESLRRSRRYLDHPRRGTSPHLTRGR